MSYLVDAPHLVLVRHGDTEWATLGRHTGVTDVPLTQAGEASATALRRPLQRYRDAVALCSPRQRARRTAELSGFSPEVDPDLAEWDYGGYEGRTTAEIRAEVGHPWTVWRDGVVPGDTPGETIDEVASRARRLLDRVAGPLTVGDVVLFGHGQSLRVLAAVFLGQPPVLGANLLLSPAGLCVLTHDRGVPAVELWNATGD